MTWSFWLYDLPPSIRRCFSARSISVAHRPLSCASLYTVTSCGDTRRPVAGSKDNKNSRMAAWTRLLKLRAAPLSTVASASSLRSSRWGESNTVGRASFTPSIIPAVGVIARLSMPGRVSSTDPPSPSEEERGRPFDASTCCSSGGSGWPDRMSWRHDGGGGGVPVLKLYPSFAARACSDSSSRFAYTVSISNARRWVHVA